MVKPAIGVTQAVIMFLGSYSKCAQVTKTVLLSGHLGGHHSILAQRNSLFWHRERFYIGLFLGLLCGWRDKVQNRLGDVTECS